MEKEVKNTTPKSKKPKAKKGAKPPKKQMAKKWQWTLVILMWGGLITPVIVVWAMLGSASNGDMPTFEELEDPRSLEATQVYSSNELLLGKYYRENRVNVDYEDISPYVIDNLVATEDERFFDHSGVDFQALGRVVKGVATGSSSQGGGSTITQQLAKMLFPRKELSTWELVQRKFKEWIIAARLEKSYTKKEIITMYLNKFDFLHNAVGIQSAARVYFNTTPDSLNIQQAAMLVGMAKNPSLFNPMRDSALVKKRREVVLKQLLKNKDNKYISTKITQADYDSLRKLPLAIKYTKVDHKEGPAPYFREHLRWYMTAQKPLWVNYIDKIQYTRDSITWEDDPLYGWCNKNKKKNGKNYDIYSDGLKIYTTIDSRMQAYAEYAVREHLGKELQAEMHKNNKKWRNPPFSNDLDEEQIARTMDIGKRRTDRYKDLKQRSASKKLIDKRFNTPVPMKIFSWKGEIDTIMSPMDSIRYYKGFLRASMVSVDPKTGFVKAWVGGPDFHHFQYDMVYKGRRQVGSTFKPIVYASAIRDGAVTPCTEFPNIQYCFDMPLGPNTKRTKPWCPGNAGEAYDGLPTQVRFALAASMNSITAAITKETKAENVVRMAESLGIQKGYLKPYPAVCLGVFDLSAYEMVGVMSAIANKGIYIRPSIVTRIEDKNGNVLADFEPDTREAMDEQLAYAMVSMMKNVVGGIKHPYRTKRVYGGTSMRLRSKSKPYGNLKYPIAAKTGTTQNQSDGWFMGLTPDLVTAVWVGGEDRAVRFRTVRLGQGANMALPIWGYYMNKVYKDERLEISKGDFEAPAGHINIDTQCSDQLVEPGEEDLLNENFGGS
jgi:penicillin-binding protein 1A